MFELVTNPIFFKIMFLKSYKNWKKHFLLTNQLHTEAKIFYMLEKSLMTHTGWHLREMLIIRHPTIK